MFDLRDKLVEAHEILSEHMTDFVQMQFNVELNMTVQHDQTAGPIFVWEPSVDLILQTQDSVVTSIEHLNVHARSFLVTLFASMSNTIMASGVINDRSITPWKGLEIEGTIFNGQYGWESSEFIDYQITTRPGDRTLVGVMTVRDKDLTVAQSISKGVELCDYVIVFVHKPSDAVTSAVIEAKKEHGEQVIIRGILSKSSSETYLYPLCRTDTLIIPLGDDAFWSSHSIQEVSDILRRMTMVDYRGVNIKGASISVTEIKSHPPEATGVIGHEKLTYMGNVLKWATESSLGNLTKNACIYREGVDQFANVTVSQPAIMKLPYMILSTSGKFNRPTKDELASLANEQLGRADGSRFLPRKLILRIMRGSARWSVFNT